MTEFWNSVVTILVAIIGIAGLAVVLSRQSNTTGVLQAGGQAFSGALGTALSPITGGGGSGSIGLPQLNLGGLSSGGAGYIA